MAIKINFDLGFLNNLFKSNGPKGNAGGSSGSASPKTPVKPMPSQQHSDSKKSSEFEEKLKREFNYYVDYLKVEKSAKILLGLFSFFVVSSIVYFMFFSDTPLIFNIFAILFVIILGAGAFFLELMLLTKRQFLVGVFIVDAYFYVYRKILVQLKKHPKRTPWLLERFKSILRVNAPFFRRVTKERYAKMTAKEREDYMKKYNEYLRRLAKTSEQEKKEQFLASAPQHKQVAKSQTIAKQPDKQTHKSVGIFGNKK